MRMSLVVIALVCLLQSGAVRAQAPVSGSDWKRVQQLPAHSRVHVSSDKISRTCSIESVEDEQLTCSAGRMVSTSHFTFARSEVKSIKVTRYAVSTAGGAAIGAGAGLIFGVASVHGKEGEFNFISNHALWGITALGGAIVGGVVGGPTDFLRGPTIYRRP